MLNKYSIHFINGEVMTIEGIDILAKLYEGNFSAPISNDSAVINPKNILYAKKISNGV